MSLGRTLLAQVHLAHARSVRVVILLRRVLQVAPQITFVLLDNTTMGDVILALQENMQAQELYLVGTVTRAKYRVVQRLSAPVALLVDISKT